MDVYEAACANVRELQTTRRTMDKMFNNALRNNAVEQINLLTKSYAQLYSAYAEASFLKLVYTPYVFIDTERKKILSERNVENKWKKILELAFENLNNDSKGERANKELKLTRIYKEYVVLPSQIRNKIAHGQWKVALNEDNTAINEDTTSRINDLDFVKIDYYFEIYTQFNQCIEDLLKSPKTHYRDYYPRIIELEEYIEKHSTWTVETRKTRLINSSKYAGYVRMHSNNTPKTTP